MENLSIEKFNPIKKEVNDLVESIKKVVISMPKGNTGYDLMKENKRTLVLKRGELKTLFKDERAGAVAYQKGIIAIEKDILEVMAPLEDELGAKIKEIDKQKLIEKRTKELPDRREKLALIDSDASDQELLEMDDLGFLEFFNQQREVYLEIKEQKIKDEEVRKEQIRLNKEEDDRLEAEKKEIARQAKLKEEEDARRAKLKKEDDERQAKVDAENKKIADARQKIADERQQIADEKQKIEDDRIAKEAEDKRLKDLEIAKIEAKKAEAKRLEDARVAEVEKKKQEQKEMEEKANYQSFLAEYGYTEELSHDFHIEREGKRIRLYKLVAETNI